MKKYFSALATFLGTVIGVGVFGLPYVASKAGFWIIIIYFILLGFFIYAIDLIFSEIISNTKHKHRLPGYADEFLGRKAKHFTFLVTIVSYTFSLFVYLLIGGKFLHNFLSPMFGGSEFVYILIYFIAGALLIYWGISSIAGAESIMLIGCLAVIVFLFVIGLPKVEMPHLATINWSNFLLPYGVVMFSLAGASIIPEIKEMVDGNKKKLKLVLASGIIITVISYLLFIIAILGVAGENTTEDALTSFVPFFSSKILAAGYLFGIFASFTSFISLGLTLKKIFSYDYSLNEKFSWFLACFLPFGLYLLGLTSFISVMGIIGGILIGIEGIIIFSMYLKLKNIGKIKNNGQHFYFSTPLIYFLILVFIFGIGLEFYYSVLK